MRKPRSSATRAAGSSVVRSGKSTANRTYRAWKVSDCDEINFRSIILRRRLCPFCVGDPTLKPAKRWANLTDQAPARRRHIQKHVSRITSWPHECPHPRCFAVLNSAEELLSHTYEIHLPDCQPRCKKGAKACQEESLEGQPAKLPADTSEDANRFRQSSLHGRKLRSR